MGQSYTHAHTHTYIQRVGGGGREGRPTTTIATDDGQRALLSLLSIVGESRDQKEKRHPRRTDQYEINTRIDVDSRRQERQAIENRRDKERKKEAAHRETHKVGVGVQTTREQNRWASGTSPV